MTRWNLTYDMLVMDIKYCSMIDNITANKALKLQKYELDDDDWKIISDLIWVLKVCFLTFIVLWQANH